MKLFQKSDQQIASESIYKTDRFDAFDFDQSVKIIPGVATEIEAAKQKFVGSPVQDGFLSLYQSNPEFDTPPPLSNLYVIYWRLLPLHLNISDYESRL